MRKLVIGDRTLTDRDVFVIAEIGSNHMGDPDVCEKMIIEAARCGVDAVKMQKRDRSMLTKTERARPYENENSFGKTYGEHRDVLDYFGMQQGRRGPFMTNAELFDAFVHFKAVAERNGVIFFATPFTLIDAEFLQRVGVPLWKLASCDVKTIPLIASIAAYGQPIIASTGGATLSEIELMAAEIEKYHTSYALLHCVSTYPNTDENVNLSAITTMRNAFPETLIGFSSHHPGIDPLKYARTLDASIFEAHFTLNRASKGTDQSFSLEQKGLAQAVEDIKRVKTMLGSSEKTPLLAEKQGFISKMGKGIYLKRPMKAGNIVQADDLCIKSPAGGLAPGEIGDIVGGFLISDLSTGVAMERGMVE